MTVPTGSDAALYHRYRALLGDTRLPAALVDLDAVDRNADRLLAAAARGGKRLRVASKSLRCPDLLRYVLDRCGTAAGGVMTYTAGETLWLARQGFRDLLLAYPTVAPRDMEDLAEANALGATAAVVVDAMEHLGPLDAAGRARGTVIPVMVDLDVAWRPAGGRLYVGARRSPLDTPDAVCDLAARVTTHRALRFHGVMAYEAHVAGLADRGQGFQGPALRAIKRAARPAVADLRARTVAALTARGLGPVVVNGAGTGSVDTAALEPALTELTAGSGFLDPHLFDGYDGLMLTPATCFAVQVVRRPAAGWITCHGGGFVASGGAGPDRLPRPWLPAGLSLDGREGAGEVQTPLRVPRGVNLQVGDPVFFRHAKAGELAEHVTAYLAVRGDSVVGHWETYRGRGQCFLG